MTKTPLDDAHAQAEADPSRRPQFFDKLAGAELFLILDEESPRVFDLADGPIVLAFDTEARLAEFAPDGADRAELTGRALVGMLAGQGVGLGLNLGEAPSAQILPPEAIDWLAEALAQRPSEARGTPQSAHAPDDLAPGFLGALDAKLSSASGLAKAALLARVTWAGGGTGHLLMILDAPEGARSALAQAVGEVLTFAPGDMPDLAVAFCSSDDPEAEQLARVALRFDVPAPGLQTAAPGRDPDRPPKLR